MSYGGASDSPFMSSKMTPRAWRMLAYAAVGFLVYGLLFIIEKAQNRQLSQIDRKMQKVYQEQLDAIDDIKTSTLTATQTSTATNNTAISTPID